MAPAGSDTENEQERLHGIKDTGGIGDSRQINQYSDISNNRNRLFFRQRLCLFPRFRLLERIPQAHCPLNQ